MVIAIGLMGCGSVKDGIWWQASGNGDLMVGSKNSRYIISSDEPLAVLIGNKVFLDGGNAVDAMVATSIALGATQPLSAGLGAGGACQALLPNSGGDLIPVAFSFGGASPADSAVAALYQLQQQQGIMPWEKMVAPAEKLIRLGFQQNGATQLQKDNPFWRTEGGLTTMPELAESYSALRLRPLSFIFGSKEGTMNYHYAANNLSYNPKMTRKTALQTLVVKNWQDLKFQPVNNVAGVALEKNQGLSAYGRGWVNYLSNLNNSGAGRRVSRAGTGLMESTVLAADESGRAISCHFALTDNIDSKPVQVKSMGFFAPQDGVKSMSARGFFIASNGSGTTKTTVSPRSLQLQGLVSLGQSARAVICKDDLSAGVFGDSCRWIKDETGLGLTLKGTR